MINKFLRSFVIHIARMRYSTDVRSCTAFVLEQMQCASPGSSTRFSLQSFLRKAKKDFRCNRGWGSCEKIL